MATAGHTNDEDEGDSHTGTYPRAGRILLAVTVLNVLNYADRYLMTGFATRIVPELGLTNTEFGLLTGPVFVALYLVAGALAGTWADRRRRPGIMAAGLALWSGITAVTGLARNFWQMALARLFVGVGEASLQPAALAMLSDSYPPHRRALAAGVFYLGIPLGVGGAFLYASAVGPWLGWRGAFYLLGGVGILGAALVGFLPDPPRGFSDTGTAADAESRLADPPALGRDGEDGLVATFLEGAKTFGRLVAASPALAWTLVASCTVAFVQGATVLDVLWWVHERGYDEAVAQRQLGLLFLSGGVVGAFVGGVGGTLARLSRVDGPLRFLFWTFVATIPMNIAYRLVPGHGAWFYILGFGGCVLFMLFYGPISAAYQDIVPAAHRGVAGGGALVLGTGSAALGSWTVGWLADFSAASFDDPYTRAIQACQTVGLLSLPALWLAARAQRQAAAREESLSPLPAPVDSGYGSGIPGEPLPMSTPREPGPGPDDATPDVAFAPPVLGWASPTDGAAPNTFRRLDGGAEIADDGSPFVAWYAGVRDTPLFSLPPADLARAVRNGLYPEEIVPLALHALEDDPLLGTEYPGELLASVALAGPAYWQAHPDALEQVVDLGQRAVRKGGDESLAVTAADLLAE